LGNNKPYYDDIPGFEGIAFDRVTGILDYFKDPVLVKWYKKVGFEEAQKISKFALKIGSRVDDLIKNDFLDGVIKLKKSELIEVRNCIEGYQSWRREYPYVRITGVEKRVWCPVLRVAGTIDIEAIDERDGSGILLDLKCSSFVAAKYWLQVGVYNSFLAVPHKHIGIVRLHKSLAFCDYKLRDYDTSYRQVYNGLLDAYRFYEQNRSEIKTESQDDSSNPPDDKVPEDSELEEPEVSNDRPTRRWEI
jgi:hypothetical protein